MLPQQIEALVASGEWRDVEFKQARTAVPKSAYETVSAFANTHGGWLVFGVAEQNETWTVVGVDKPDKVQNDFLSVLHADEKVNHDVAVTEHRLLVDGKVVLAFYIAENQRTRKPVYLDGDIRRTFLRKGGGDYHAQMQDIERMLRDATSDRWDGGVFERVSLEEAFDSASLGWYRNRFHTVNDGFDPRQPDIEFLYDWGYLVKQAGELMPTRGAVMLFGSLRGVRNLIPRPTLDVQFLGYATDEPMPETRWIDRFVSEENIVQTWLKLVAKYKFFMPKPFRHIDPVTLGRRDDPPGFRVFREASINQLIHQDYGDHSRKAVIKFHRDGILFWNPGDVFGDDTHLFDPGEKEVRNPTIVTAMRRIAMCEQAGTGMRLMRQEWQRLGHPEPTYTNDRAAKSFEFFIPELDDEVDMASELLGAMFGLQPGASVPSLSQVCPKSVPSDVALKILETAMQPVSMVVLMKAVGSTNRSRFRTTLLKTMIAANLLEMTNPDHPRSSSQRYTVTATGRAVVQGHSHGSLPS